MTGWILLAFAGAYDWTTIPFSLGVALLVAVERPRIAIRGSRLLDLSLIAGLAILGIQLIPLPAPVRQALSPAALTVERALHFVSAGGGAPETAALSLDADRTAWAFALAASYVGLFWSARSVFARGGVRLTARAVTWMGLALAAFAMVQHAIAPTLIYGYWQPLSAGARPYGPFVNRNSLATWLMMAIPLVIGYTLMRVWWWRDSHVQRAAILEATDVWLAASACLMTGALLSSLSRSGIVGGAAGLGTFVLLSQHRVSRGQRTLAIVVALGVMVAIAMTYVNLGALAARVNRAIELGVGGRWAIWADTWRMATDFWLAGVGAGAYERGMLVYQQGSRQFFYNQAHNEYLQLLVEGGVGLAAAAALGLAGGARRVIDALRADQSAMFWLRAGAASGLTAVAVQSLWDTGLRIPANAALFALLAAIAVYEPEHAVEREQA